MSEIREKKILSIIIPTYNMEKYLQKCLNSLIIEDKGLFNGLEVLVINDGSRDRSLEIAKVYEDKYPGIFKVIDKENGNYGSCINRGLREAKGKYVKVLDADDSFDTYNFAKLLEEMNSADVDVFISDFDIVNEEGKVKQSKTFSFPRNVSFDIRPYINDFGSIEMHAVAYRTQNLREISYVQTEGISYTDSEWVFYPFTKIKTAFYIPTAVYKYLVGRDGQTVAIDIFHKKVQDRVKIIKNIIPLYNSYINTDPDSPWIPVLKKRLIAKIYTIMISYLIVNRDNEAAKDFDYYLNDESKELYEDSACLYLMKGINYKFIKNWRATRSLPNKLVSYLYLTLKKFR